MDNRPLNLQIVRDYTELSRAAAEHILRCIKQHPNMAILVPTGTTPQGTYELLRQQPAEIFNDVTLFNMDEYCTRTNEGNYELLPAHDERSYRYYMRRHLLNYLPNIRSFFPETDNVQNPGKYDQLIAANGGLDLCLNSIGEDGHTFGFNFPGSSFSSISRLVKVNEDTASVNQKLTGFTIPEYALTTGITTGMAAKEILVIASGKRKSDILRRALNDEISEANPVTILRTHPQCTWIVDEDAASEL